jgi:hypothetical protein
MRASTISRVDRHDAQFAKHSVRRELPGARPGHLMPAAEKGADGVVPMALHPVPRLPHRAVAEVVGPSPHRAVSARPTSTHGAWLPGRNRRRILSRIEAMAFCERRAQASRVLRPVRSLTRPEGGPWPS